MIIAYEMIVIDLSIVLILRYYNPTRYLFCSSVKNRGGGSDEERKRVIPAYRVLTRKKEKRETIQAFVDTLVLEELPVAIILNLLHNSLHFLRSCTSGDEKTVGHIDND